MIKERHVSLEVARLLKEKGFNEECHRAYVDVTLEWTNTIYGEDAMSNDEIPDIDTDVITAPTQQMACDWVQAKNVLVTYDLSCPFGSKLMVKVYRKDYDLDWIEATTIIRNTLEDAINDALEYALKKLI